MSGQNILIAIFAGLFAGWTMDLIARDRGLTLVGCLTIAVLGAILGEALLPYTGLNPGRSMVAILIDAGLGAALALFVIRIVRPSDGAAGRKP